MERKGTLPRKEQARLPGQLLGLMTQAGRAVCYLEGELHQLILVLHGAVDSTEGTTCGMGNSDHSLHLLEAV